jgi:hypothetical protein
MPFDAFISYSSKDKTTANAACAALEAAGVRCWIAPRDIRAGAEYGAGIIEGIDACRIMILIFSANANASPQIHREIERAVSKGLTIVPFRIEDILPTAAMEYYLGAIHWLDALTPPLAEHLAKLIDQSKANLAAGNDTANAAPAGLFAPPRTPPFSPQGARKRPRSVTTMAYATQLVLLVMVLALSAAVFLIWRSVPTPVPIPDRPPNIAMTAPPLNPAPPAIPAIPAQSPQPASAPTPPPPPVPKFAVTRTAGFGGNGGAAFDDLEANADVLPVSAVTVGVNLNPADQSQRIIGALQIQWGGKTGPMHGGMGPLAQPVSMLNLANEKIGRVDINWGPYHFPTSDNKPPQWVAGLQIWTDVRVYAFGDVKLGHTSQCILADKEVLLGFFGRSGSYIDQLGCIIGKPK